MLSLRPLKSFFFLPLLPFLACSPIALADVDDEEPESAGETSEEEEAPVLDDDAPPSVPGGRRVTTLHWKDYNRPAGSTADHLGGEDNEMRTIECTAQNGGTYTLLTLEKPALKSPYYALKGEIRYRNVSGAGYLELLNRFPGQEEEPFTRTQAEAGPMKRIERRSRWRQVWIPFDASAVGQQPDRLTLRLVMASVGIVELGPMELYEFSVAKSMWAVAKAGKSDVESIESLSNPQRRSAMALTLVTIAAVLGGMHYTHLRLEKRKA